MQMQQQQTTVEYKPHKTPNILVTGTPGTGKTTFCQLLNQSLSFQYIAVGQMIKQNKLYDEWDDDLNVPIFNQQMLVGFIEKQYDLEKGGIIVDFHSPTDFPSHWFDLIVVMRCNNDILYKRLEERNYEPAKIKENIECEIFQEIKLDVDEAFANRLECVLQLRNQQNAQMQQCIDKALQWLVQFKNKTSQ